MAGRVYRQFVLLLGKLFLARIWVHRLTLIFHHTCLLGYKIGMLIPGKFPRWEMNFPGLDRDLKWRRQHRQRSMCYQQLTSASAVELKSHWHMKCGLITRRHNAVPPPQLSSVHTWQAELLVWPCMVATSNMSAWCTHAHTALSNATEDQFDSACLPSTTGGWCHTTSPQCAGRPYPVQHSQACIQNDWLSVKFEWPESFWMKWTWQTWTAFNVMHNCV